MAYRPIVAVLAALSLTGCGGPDNDPMTPASESTGAAEGDPAARAAEREAALKRWLAETYSADRRIGYRSSEFDLDGDGGPETLVYVGAPEACESGGCSLVVLRSTGDRLAKISEIRPARLPLGVLDTRSNGWADLWVSTEAGGELTGRRVLAFNGVGYPADPTKPPAGELKILDAPVLIEEGDLLALD